MFDATMAALEKALDIRMRAHEVHISNVANANVPDYKARKVDFEARMREALQPLEQETGTQIERENTVQARVANVEAEVYEDPLAVMNGDGNTVNMDKEQSEIAKNTIGYEGAIQLMSKKFALQKFVLGEGGR